MEQSCARMNTILIVEDDQLVRESLHDMLHLEGYQVRSASSGHEGLHHARSQAPDLVLCDIMMPGMDGYQFLEELRKQGAKPSPLFIFISARVSPADVERSRQAGADAYLRKPASKQAVLKTIRELLGRRQEGTSPPPPS